MAARPRIRKRAHFPPNLHEPRPGYFTWRDPRDGKTHIIGRVPLAQAIHEANEANVIATSGQLQRSLSERVAGGSHTVAELLDRLPLDHYKKTSLANIRSLDRAIKDAIGHIECSALTTKHVADMLEAIKERGAVRMSQSVRSRITVACRKGVSLGWMPTNPAEITEKVRVKVQRRRLTLPDFKAILEKAPAVAPWLENAMLLALVTGQDRSTIANWQRSTIQGDVIIAHRPKTDARIAIPLALRMDAIGMSVGDVIARCKATGVISRYLVHHVKSWGPARRGGSVRLSSITSAFNEARELAGIRGDNAPTFHEIRSLCKRVYMEQGGVDTKALLGHMSDATAAIYANTRGLEPIKVKVVSNG